MFGNILWIVLAALGEKTNEMLKNLLAASSAIRSSIGSRPLRAKQASVEVDLKA
jgi:hypothetical protein